MSDRLLRGLAVSLRRRFRQTRYVTIRRLTGLGSTSGLILDLGGGPASFFVHLFPFPNRVILLDIDREGVALARRREPHLAAIVADGEHLPFVDHAFALLVCNSVIEHVDDAVQLAAEIRRVGQRYFLQTPNPSFPVETHSMIAIPFYNRVRSVPLQRLLCRLFGANYDYIASVKYLYEEDLRRLFPEAEIDRETVLGLTKSYYVIGVGSGR